MYNDLKIIFDPEKFCCLRILLDIYASFFSMGLLTSSSSQIVRESSLVPVNVVIFVELEFYGEIFESVNDTVTFIVPLSSGVQA